MEISPLCMPYSSPSLSASISESEDGYSVAAITVFICFITALPVFLILSLLSLILSFSSSQLSIYVPSHSPVFSLPFAPLLLFFLLFNQSC